METERRRIRLYRGEEGRLGAIDFVVSCVLMQRDGDTAHVLTLLG